MIAPLQNTVSATKNFQKVFTTLMRTGDATQKHRNVQAAVNALALKDRDQCVLFEKMLFSLQCNAVAARVVYQDVE